MSYTIYACACVCVCEKEREREHGCVYFTIMRKKFSISFLKPKGKDQTFTSRSKHPSEKQLNN